MILTALARRLHRYALAEQYPTRTAEWLLAGFIFAWSYSCVLPEPYMVGPIYSQMLEFMPESQWGIIGITFSSLRVLALIGNGHWKPSPGLRMIGAVTGGMFWIAVFGLYTQAVMNGAPDFPMRRSLLVLIVGEFYSCFRCGQDFMAMLRKKPLKLIGATRKGDAGYG